MTKPWLSKTLWVNVIVALLALFGIHADSFIAQNPQIIILAVAGINFVLRLVTKQPIGLSDS